MLSNRALEATRMKPRAPQRERLGFAMTDDPTKAKWHAIDPTTAKQLTEQTTSPGLVYPVPSNAIPDQLKKMRGVVDFYVSSYAGPISITPGIAAAVAVENLFGHPFTKGKT